MCSTFATHRQQMFDDLAQDVPDEVKIYVGCHTQNNLAKDLIWYKTFQFYLKLISITIYCTFLLDENSGPDMKNLAPPIFSTMWHFCEIMQIGRFIWQGQISYLWLAPDWVILEGQIWYWNKMVDHYVPHLKFSLSDFTAYMLSKIRTI